MRAARSCRNAPGSTTEPAIPVTPAVHRRLRQRLEGGSGAALVPPGTEHPCSGWPARPSGKTRNIGAFDLGCTLFDTAEVYADGADEHLVGRAPAPIRDQVVVAAKFYLDGSHTRTELGRKIRAHLEASSVASAGRASTGRSRTRTG
ncbi:aldo/keto reductase [Streptomyces justiciae]|uniref:Aldo/keto reductase n=1 Tax=Streptomyces justiciae TaxID=2780140 RepID=A0ABU3M144_9ACTN|nr:aldo/keto reductase [Streptomyces justiciae]MDT7844522.1 aldo/keto reductase [Streptomyces justiciae]